MTNAPRLQRLDQELFELTAKRAIRSPRRRQNYNFHQPEDAVQRFLNVLQPGTYVRPHRHQRDRPGAGFECFLVLQGSVGLLLFDASGQMIQHERLSASGPLHGIEVVENQLHSLVALEPDSVIFELKQGPYIPSSDKDFLAGYPMEGTTESVIQERKWRDLFI